MRYRLEMLGWIVIAVIVGAALMVVFLISAVTATAQDVGRAASGHH
jgi:hypothetical protein